MVRISKEEFEHHSGCDDSWYSRTPYIKRRHYKVENVFLGGDQPKVFVRLYQYGHGVRKAKQNTWPTYLAKFARKWYPVESITEHLITVLGKALYVDMAETQLCIIEGQLRLASKYFLNENERLVHGADLLSKYLGDDTFVELIDAEKMEGDLFSYYDAKSAIEDVFSSNAQQLICKFHQMLILDCILGVNDRHFFNWGIITDVTGNNPPRFAPLFDTSRGLLWNYSEHKISSIFTDKRIAQAVENYILSSRPKMSMPGLVSPSHFDFIEKLGAEVPEVHQEATRMLQNGAAPLIKALRGGFVRLLSKKRIELIETILHERISLTLSRLNL